MNAAWRVGVSAGGELAEQSLCGWAWKRNDGYLGVVSSWWVLVVSGDHRGYVWQIQKPSPSLKGSSVGKDEKEKPRSLESPISVSAQLASAVRS